MKRVMKIALCVFLGVSVMCGSVSAKTPDFTLDLGDDYLYFAVGADFSRAAQITGMTEAQISEFFDENDLVMLALSEDNKRQVRVAHYDNKISKKIGNLSSMTTEDIRDIAEELVDDVALAKPEIVIHDVVEYSDAKKYMCFTESLADSGGEYTVTQYITVVDGAFWHITAYNPPDSDAQFSPEHLTIGDDGGLSASNILYAVSFVFAVFAVVMLIVYLRERRKETQENSIE